MSASATPTTRTPCRCRSTSAFDLTAAYKQPRYEVRFNVFNLFNTMYYDSLMASDGGRAVPGSGTTGLLTLTYRM